MGDVKIPKQDFIKEHTKLLRVLRTPSREDDTEEYQEQAKELSDVLKEAATRLRAIS